MVCESGFLDLRPRFKNLSQVFLQNGGFGADEVLLISLLNNVSLLFRVDVVCVYSNPEAAHAPRGR